MLWTTFTEFEREQQLGQALLKSLLKSNLRLMLRKQLEREKQVDELENLMLEFHISDS